jgi:predicted nucleic acid-binding protein
MVLVDTCGWIEWLTDSPLAVAYAPYLDAADDLLVPTLVQHELYKWLCRERDIPAALSAIAATRSAKVLPLDTSLALLAANVAGEFKLATADAIIYATARQHGAKLITSDAHFGNLPDVIFLAKGG